MTTTTELQDVEKIIVLDYGSQYSQLISRHPWVVYFLNSRATRLQRMKSVLSVLLGLSRQVDLNSVYEEGSFDIDPEIFELGFQF